MIHRFVLAAALLVSMSGHRVLAASPVVLELFTSQGCSSCPPADALMERLAQEDTGLLPLSLHINYWDRLGWKDAYSSPLNTQRQKGYAESLGVGQIFTPQLVVNGEFSVVGFDEDAVRRAIASVRQQVSPVQVTIMPDISGNLIVTVTGDKRTADVAEIDFDHYARTQVKAGENSGRVLESINNVTAIKRIGVWPDNGGRYVIPASAKSGSGVAIIVQEQPMGTILGSGSYIRP